MRSPARRAPRCAPLCGRRRRASPQSRGARAQATRRRGCTRSTARRPRRARAAAPGPRRRRRCLERARGRVCVVTGRPARAGRAVSPRKSGQHQRRNAPGRTRPHQAPGAAGTAAGRTGVPICRRCTPRTGPPAAGGDGRGGTCARGAGWSVYRSQPTPPPRIHGYKAVAGPLERRRGRRGAPVCGLLPLGHRPGAQVHRRAAADGGMHQQHRQQPRGVALPLTHGRDA